MVDAEEVEDGGVEIVDVDGVGDDVVAEVVRLADGAAMTVCLAIAVFGNFVFVKGVFANSWKVTPFMLLYALPLACWMVAIYLNVVRFLRYLDLRIRHEGWEVELRMRAEANRMVSKQF